jgi:hypothetical protein
MDDEGERGGGGYDVQPWGASCARGTLLHGEGHGSMRVVGVWLLIIAERPLTTDRSFQTNHVIGGEVSVDRSCADHASSE